MAGEANRHWTTNQPKDKDLTHRLQSAGTYPLASLTITVVKMQITIIQMKVLVKNAVKG